jgi:hypothetical protein
MKRREEKVEMEILEVELKILSRNPALHSLSSKHNVRSASSHSAITSAQFRQQVHHFVCHLVLSIHNLSTSSRKIATSTPFPSVPRDEFVTHSITPLRHSTLQTSHCSVNKAKSHD